MRQQAAKTLSTNQLFLVDLKLKVSHILYQWKDKKSRNNKMNEKQEKIINFSILKEKKTLDTLERNFI